MLLLHADLVILERVVHHTFLLQRLVERSYLFKLLFLLFEALLLELLVPLLHLDVEGLAIRLGFYGLLDAQTAAPGHASEPSVLAAGRRHWEWRNLSHVAATRPSADGHKTATATTHLRVCTGLAWWQPLTRLLTDRTRLCILQLATTCAILSALLLSQLIHHSTSLSKWYFLEENTILGVSDLIHAFFLCSEDLCLNRCILFRHSFKIDLIRCLLSPFSFFFLPSKPLDHV